MNGIFKQEYGLGAELPSKAVRLPGGARKASSSTTPVDRTARWAIAMPAEVHRGGAQLSAPARLWLSPLHPPAGCPATGTQAHDLSCELEFKDQLRSALPQSPTSPSSRFAES